MLCRETIKRNFIAPDLIIQGKNSKIENSMIDTINQLILIGGNHTCFFTFIYCS